MSVITSETPIPIEQHFKVNAGPGSGKTFWLIQHIKNVLQNSARLGRTRNVACISYTNVGVETILDRLGPNTDGVEVSTIHAFLYKHIVKPYAKFVAAEFGLDVSKMDGHDDTILTNYSFLAELKSQTGQQRITDDRTIVAALHDMRWVFGTAGILEVKTKFPHRFNGYNLKNATYSAYKKLAWAKGILHHDDVLFFSYQILTEKPFVATVLRAKFPYFFVDEFQDTHPIQAKILQILGQSETIVGVIGDVAQSIFGFQGADPTQFTSFTISGMVEYSILDNRRSTNAIVDLLNKVRTGLNQGATRSAQGEQPILFVGDAAKAYAECISRCGNAAVHSLAYENVVSNTMKRGIGGQFFDGKLLDKLFEVDPSTSSTNYRSSIVLSYIKAVELARQSRFKEAIHEIERRQRGRSDKEVLRKEALQRIMQLLADYDSFQNGSLFEFFEKAKRDFDPQIPRMNAGTRRSFYQNHTYQQIAVCVSITEDNSLHRTIHKSKGAEFEYVLVLVPDSRFLGFLTAPDLFKDQEDHRVYYVAMSRARDRLFFNVPSLQSTQRAALGASIVEIIDL
jgi:DNA helicase II / ATP-dependent DNA helicase PcrA